MDPGDKELKHLGASEFLTVVILGTLTIVRITMPFSTMGGTGRARILNLALSAHRTQDFSNPGSHRKALASHSFRTPQIHCLRWVP